MRSLLYFSFALLILAETSCRPAKTAQYLENSVDSLPAEVKFAEPVIQAGDLLSITVFSDNSAASAMYNQTAVAAALPGSSISAQPAAAGNSPGYLVSNDGFIIFPGLGTVKAAGLSKKQLADTLVNYFVQNMILKNPACDIRFLNYRITVLGEVARPGVYSVPVEKLSVLEALGLAGDITVWAKRDNVTIIRETGGDREFGRLDLNSSQIFNSPFYYLKQNDIVIIGQNKRKIRSTDQTTLRYVAISTSILSTIAILVNIFKN